MTNAIVTILLGMLSGKVMNKIEVRKGGNFLTLLFGISAYIACLGGLMWLSLHINPNVPIATFLFLAGVLGVVKLYESDLKREKLLYALEMEQKSEKS